MKEKDDEIRYLQVELESALSDRQQPAAVAHDARQATVNRLRFISETMEVCCYSCSSYLRTLANNDNAIPPVDGKRDGTWNKVSVMIE